MNNIDQQLEQAAILRRRARVIAEGKAALLPRPEDLSPAAARQMLHELRVHQIELEMQNDELRRMQQALAVERERYFDLYDRAPVGYGMLSESGLIRQVNRCFANLLGVSREALINRQILSLIETHDRDIFYLYRQRLIASDEPQVCELRMQKAGDGFVWMRLESQTAHEPVGVGMLRVVLSDISEHKRTEAVLLANEEQYRGLAEAMPMFIETFAPDGTLTYVNDALCALVAKTREELIGRNFNDFLSVADRVLVA